MNNERSLSLDLQLLFIDQELSNELPDSLDNWPRRIINSPVSDSLCDYSTPHLEEQIMPDDAIERLSACITEGLTSNARNNFSRLQNVSYFSGGPVTSPDKPEVRCIAYAKRWIEEIEVKTPTSLWDNDGRFEVIQHYSLGPAKEYVQSILRDLGSTATWDSFKDRLFKIFPQERNLNKVIAEFLKAAKSENESFLAFHSRLFAMTLELKSLGSDQATINSMFTATFISCLPSSFTIHLKDTDKDNPELLWKKFLKFQQSNPEAGASVKKKVVNAFSTTGGNATQQTSKRNYGNSKGDKQETVCQRCARPGHKAPNCKIPMNKIDNFSKGQRKGDEIRCQRCMGRRHISRNCAMPWDKIEARNKERRDGLCHVCQLPGHLARDCTQRNKGNGNTGSERTSPAYSRSSASDVQSSNSGAAAMQKKTSMSDQS